MTLALRATTVAAAAGEGARIGKPAPNFSVEDLHGKPVVLNAYRSRPIFITVFATWCSPCRKELSYVVRRFPRYRSRVVFVGIDEQESPSIVKAFAASLSLPFGVGIDPGAVAVDYGVRALPLSVFIDRDGIVRALVRGSLRPPIFERDIALIDGR
ncbi:MAG: TlpA family protein disulfide reductase [Candidatus Eremiobacteraeota bacterium]|nr:TlpA family protein disulfide reductase [Candidatus Eremiobacteraeota bacterium]